MISIQEEDDLTQVQSQHSVTTELEVDGGKKVSLGMDSPEGLVDSTMKDEVTLYSSLVCG